MPAGLPARALSPDTLRLTDSYSLTSPFSNCLHSNNLRVSLNSGEGNGSPIQYPCLRNPKGQRSQAGYRPWGHQWVGHDFATKEQKQRKSDLILVLNDSIWVRLRNHHKVNSGSASKSACLKIIWGIFSTEAMGQRKVGSPVFQKGSSLLPPALSTSLPPPPSFLLPSLPLLSLCSFHHHCC